MIKGFKKTKYVIQLDDSGLFACYIPRLDAIVHVDFFGGVTLFDTKSEAEEKMKLVNTKFWKPVIKEVSVLLEE